MDMTCHVFVSCCVSNHICLVLCMYIYIYIWLVVSNTFFSTINGIFLPIDFHIFKMVKATNQYIYIYIHAQFVQHIEFTQLYSLYLLIDSGGS